MLASLLSAGACSTLPATPSADLPSLGEPASETLAGVGVSTPAPEPTLGERIGRAAEMLSVGKASEARIELQTALAKSPQDATAELLLSQIETDPTTLLGPPSQTYVVQAGDTMSGIADRFLGNSLMFYALSRYNGLAAPNALVIGRTLKIPDSSKSPATNATILPQSNKPAIAAAKSVDAAKANTVRLEALQHLNTGDVLRAIALLKEAVSLDGTDPAIRRDLDRALRIQTALEAG